MSKTPDPIKHVVVLMMENHSFDQMLGALRQTYPGLTGPDPQNPKSNTDPQGRVFLQQPTEEREVLIDPFHDVDNVAEQMKDGNGGFVRDFAKQFPDSSPEARQFVMGYYPLGFLPALHTLANDFMICERWHSSVPGPTWTNRFFALSGTSSGRVNMPQDGHHWLDIKGWFEQDQTTIFDRLNEKNVPWKVYFHDIPLSLVLRHQRRLQNLAHYRPINRFYRACRGPEQDFPAFSFIEPDYAGSDENDDHPPHDILKAQKLIADVYNAIRANDELWKSTLFVLLYDEHGGFYDQVIPPPAVEPDDKQSEFVFNRLGIRVPALLISPWVQRGYDSTTFDHTSLLRYLIDKWDLGKLGNRTAAANSIAPLIATMAEPRTDTVERIDVPVPPIDPGGDSGQFVSEHHRAIVMLEHFLFAELDESLPRIYLWFARKIRHVRGRVLSWFRRKPASEENIRARYQKLQEAIPQFLQKHQCKANSS